MRQVRGAGAASERGRRRAAALAHRQRGGLRDALPNARGGPGDGRPRPLRRPRPRPGGGRRHRGHRRAPPRGGALLR
eukprot:6017270-Pyramimonas_sp.AAC.1